MKEENVIRINPTYTSSVFPLQSWTPMIKNSKANGGEIKRKSSTHENNEDKWAVNKEDVIPEKSTKDKQKIDMYKMYMGIKDTPFQRLFKELHGNKGETPTISNVRKQGELPTNIYFNSYSNKHGVYEDLDAKGRRAKEFDSCVWAENKGNYKSFHGEDLTTSKRNKLASTTSWLNKHTEVVNNNERNINPVNSVKEQLSSHVLPMTDYTNLENKAEPNNQDLQHETEHRKEQENKMKNCGLKKPYDGGNPQSNKKANILEIFNRNELIPDPVLKVNENGNEASDIENINNADLLASSRNRHHNSKSISYFDKKNTLNISGLRKQEFMASQLALNNHYEDHINKKIDGFINHQSEGSDLLPSDTLNHKEKKQLFLEGQDNRMMFSDTYFKNKSKTLHGSESQSDGNVHTLELSSVPSHLTIDDLKRALKIKQVISLELETDNIKNVNTGKGKIVFRANVEDGRESVMERLNTVGIDSKDYARINKQKAPRIATTSVGWIDSKNEIDMIKSKAFEREVDDISESKSENKTKKKVTGKIGENLFLKPSNSHKSAKNETNMKRINFYESNSDLFGNTNGAFAKLHTERFGKEKVEFHKSTKDNRAQHLMANDWVKMQKKIDMFASNRAIQPKTTRYGKTYNF